METGISEDIHICGCCKTQFSSIQDFIVHKQQNCISGKQKKNIPSQQNCLDVISNFTTLNKFPDPPLANQNGVGNRNGVVNSYHSHKCTSTDHYVTMNSAVCSVQSSPKIRSAEPERNVTYVPEPNISHSRQAQTSVAYASHGSAHAHQTSTTCLLSKRNVQPISSIVYPISDVSVEEKTSTTHTNPFVSSCNASNSANTQTATVHGMVISIPNFIPFSDGLQISDSTISSTSLSPHQTVTRFQEFTPCEHSEQCESNSITLQASGCEQVALATVPPTSSVLHHCAEEFSEIVTTDANISSPSIVPVLSSHANNGDSIQIAKNLTSKDGPSETILLSLANSCHVEKNGSSSSIVMNTSSGNTFTSKDLPTSVINSSYTSVSIPAPRIQPRHGRTKSRATQRQSSRSISYTTVKIPARRMAVANTSSNIQTSAAQNGSLIFPNEKLTPSTNVLTVLPNAYVSSATSTTTFSAPSISSSVSLPSLALQTTPVLSQPEILSSSLLREQTNQMLLAPASSTVTPSFFVSDTSEIETCAEDREADALGLAAEMVNEINSPRIRIKYKIMTVEGAKKYKCEYESCSYITSYMKDLERHFRIHTGERPYLCPKCGKTFSRMDKMKSHERWHLGIKPHKCTICSYETRDQSSLKKHNRIHTDERPFKCQICPYASRSTSQLTVHLRTHTGDTPFHCSVCSAKFKINSDLKRHMRMHTGEKPFRCTLCEYCSSVKANLTSHMRINHSLDKKWTCSKCDFSSPSKKKVREHEHTHKTKPFSCHSCSYTSSSKPNLKAHLRIHTNEKPYKCEHCAYSSRQSCNLKTHIKKNHPDSIPTATKRKVTKCTDDPEENSVNSISEKPSPRRKKRATEVSRPACKKIYKCRLCKNSFVREDSLRSHLRHHIKQTCEPAALAMLQLQEHLERPSDTSVQNPDLLPTSAEEKQSSLLVSGTLTERSENSEPVTCDNLQFSSTAVEPCLVPINDACALQNSVMTCESLENAAATTLSTSALNSNENHNCQVVSSNMSDRNICDDDQHDLSLVQKKEISKNPASALTQNVVANEADDTQESAEKEHVPDNGSSSDNFENGSGTPQVSVTISKTEAATLLAQIQNNNNLAREDNFQASGNTCSAALPPDLMTVPVSSLLPVSFSFSNPQLPSPVQNAAALVTPSVTLTNQNELSNQKNTLDTPNQLFYQFQPGLSIITIPVVSVNPGNMDSAAVENTVGISKQLLSVSCTGLNENEVPFQQPAVINQPQTAAVLQLSNVSPSVQYILQPENNSVRLEVSGIQMPSDSNPKDGVPSDLRGSLQTNTILSPSRFLATGPLGSVGEMAVLFGGTNSTDGTQHLWSNFNA